jgi:PIN domain nuclease of toxin-antitoxin system
MRLLLDTHFVLWAIVSWDRLDDYPWLDGYQPWGVSPVSILELQYLAEIGRIEVRQPELLEALGVDPRFVIDEVPLMALVRQALELGWTRDPFDRLLAAHSLARRTPLCTLDRALARHHPLLPPELGRPA